MKNNPFFEWIDFRESTFLRFLAWTYFRESVAIREN